MKKTISILLSLIFCLSLITALPTCASSATTYRIPKAVTIISPYDQAKGTITFTVGNGTLTETAVLPDEGVSGFTDYAELAFLPGNADLNQQLISIDRAMTDYPYYPNPMIFSPLLQSGKIHKIVIKKAWQYKENGKTKTYGNNSNTLTVKASDGKVTQLGNETYTYDAKGNLIAQSIPFIEGEPNVTIHYYYDSNNHLIRIQADGILEPGDPNCTYQWNTNNISDYQIRKGKIVEATNDFENVTFNSDGTYKTYDFYFASHSVTYQNVVL